MSQGEKKERCDQILQENICDEAYFKKSSNFESIPINNQNSVLIKEFISGKIKFLVRKSKARVMSSNPRVRTLKVRVARLKARARRSKARVEEVKPSVQL